MSDVGSFPPGHGYAWRGDWKQRLLELVQSRGYSSVSDFADARALGSLVGLANELGGGDVAAAQIETALIEEARAAGTLDYRARDLLARRLAALPSGWPGPASTRTREQDSHAMNALSGWAPQTLPELTMDDIVAIGTALLQSASLATGWRPTGPDDPVIVELFRSHWRPKS